MWQRLHKDLEKGDWLLEQDIEHVHFHLTSNNLVLTVTDQMTQRAIF